MLRLFKIAATLVALLLGLAAFAAPGASPAFADPVLLNVSYDPTRELYRAIDAAFAEKWKKDTGETVTIQQSHGGSGAQARAVIDGLDADVVTLALAADIDAIAAKTGKIPADWQKQLPNNSSPYTSTIVFLVRKGNPKGIHDWRRSRQARRLGHHAEPEDLGRGALELSSPPGATASRPSTATRQKTRDFVAAIYKNVPVLDTGARGSTMTFAKRGLGDVLIAWENDAFLALDEFGKDQFEIVAPSLSILAEPPVARGRRQRRRQGHAQGRRGLSQLSLHARSAGDHRQEPLPPDPSGIRRQGRSRAVSEARPDHRRRNLRRLEIGAGEVLRRRRRLRPVPEGEPVTQRRERAPAVARRPVSAGEGSRRYAPKALDDLHGQRRERFPSAAAAPSPASGSRSASPRSISR